MAEGGAGGGQLTPDDALDLVEELLPAKIRSRELGLALKLPPTVISEIHDSFSDPRLRLFHILLEFTSQSQPRPTWRLLIDALRSSEVRLPALAHRLEEIYIPTSVPSTTAEFEGSGSSSTSSDEFFAVDIPVAVVKENVKGLRKRFGFIRKSAIECLDRCQIAVMTVVTLLSSVLRFDVRKAIRDSHHKDVSECKNNSELFGYLNLYWNYLSFKPLSLLLDELALKDDFSNVRKELSAHFEDVKKFQQDTSLATFCLAVPYNTEREPPPGLKKMISEHEWPEMAELSKVEKFEKSFLDTFGLPVEHAMMMDGIRTGSFKVTWFAVIPPTTLQLLKGSRGNIKSLRDFKVSTVEIDGQLVYYDDAQTSSLVITEEQFFTSGFSSLIDTKILEEHLIKYGVLDEGSLPATQGLRDRWIMVHGPDAMDYVMYRLGKKENGLQLLYQSLRQTQHTYFPHMRIVWELETAAENLLTSTSSHAPVKDPSHLGKEQSSSSDVATSTAESVAEYFDNEPYITEDVFISCVGCLFVEDFGIELVLSELEKYGVVDESSFHIVLSLSSKRRMIDRFHFIMYKLGRRENGLQTFYRCMKETKDRVPEHSDAVHILAFKALVTTDVPASSTVLQKESIPSVVQKGSHSCKPQSPSPLPSPEPEEIVEYTGTGLTYNSPNGISLDFPALAEGECESAIKISLKVVNDEYILPDSYEDMDLVSSMFKIAMSAPLPVPVTVRMEHCAVIEEDNSLVYMIAYGPPPYRFKPLEGGIFPIGEYYGEIEMKKFCTLTQSQKREVKMSLSVHIFYHNHTNASFVATRNLRTLNRAVESKYASAIRVVEQSMSCDSSTKAISLTIPPASPGGWLVEAEFEPAVIETRLIREYRPGKTPPSIHLSMTWKGSVNATEERVRIRVRGASLKSFFLICKPENTSSFSDSSLSLLSSQQHQTPSLEESSVSPQPASPQSPFSSPASSISHPSTELPTQHTHCGLGPSVESIVLRRSNTILTRSGDPENLVTVLFSKLLLTPEEKAKVLQQSLTVGQKMEEIFQTMERRVSASPAHFHTLVQVLKEEPAMRTVGETMQGMYYEERKRLQSL